MIDHILARYRPSVEAAVIVVDPAGRARVQDHLRSEPLPLSLAEQASPTGMLDALLAGRDEVLARQPDRVWITWCDQVAISAHTVAKLVDLEKESPAAAVLLPVVHQPTPYIHLEHDHTGRLAAVRHRREGDTMPDVGLSDAGLFSLSREAFDRFLPEYSRAAALGAKTGERNFLPFLPWLAAQHPVRTFEIDVNEARGVNTPDDLASVEQWLRAHQGDKP